MKKTINELKNMITETKIAIMMDLTMGIKNTRRKARMKM